MDFNRHKVSTKPMAPWAIQVGGLCGIGFAVLSLVSLALQLPVEFLPANESTAAVARYFAGRSEPAWLPPVPYLTLLFQLVFFCVLYAVLRQRDPVSAWPLVGLVAAGFASGAAWMVVTNFASLLGTPPDAGDSPALRIAWMQYDVGGFALGMLCIPILAGFGMALWRSGARGSGGFALAVATACAVALVGDGIRGSAVASLGLLTYMLFLAWGFATALGLARAKSPSVIRRRAWANP